MGFLKALLPDPGDFDDFEAMEIAYEDEVWWQQMNQDSKYIEGQEHERTVKN